MKQTLKIILFSLCITAFFTSTALAEIMAGQPMICGKKTDLMSYSTIYKETEFMVFQEELNSQTAYFMLYRNAKTGTWTFVAYNIPNAPPNTVCLLHGGMGSYLLPSIEEIKKTLKKQDKGFDEPNKPEDADKVT